MEKAALLRRPHGHLQFVVSTNQQVVTASESAGIITEVVMGSMDIPQPVSVVPSHQEEAEKEFMLLLHQDTADIFQPQLPEQRHTLFIAVGMHINPMRMHH